MSASESAPWREVSEIPTLGKFQIQVWRINLACSSAEVARLKNYLSAEENGQAARFHFAPDQRRFIVRRAVLRQLLPAHLKINSAAVEIESANFCKPAVTGQKNPNRLKFNSSHSADCALIAIAREQEVGVDLEQHRPLPDAGELAGNFFSNDEISELKSLPPELKRRGFFNCWTRKEAFVKAIGLGLSFPLNRFSVSLSPEKPAAILAVAGDSAALEKWTLVALDAAPNCSAALVFENKNSPVEFFEWNFQLIEKPGGDQFNS